MIYFPVFVTLAWTADRHRLFFKCLRKGYGADKRRGIVEEMEGDQEPEGIEVIMDERFPDGSLCLGHGTVSTETGRTLDRSKDEASGTGNG